MKTVKWLIQDDSFPDDLAPLRKILKEYKTVVTKDWYDLSDRWLNLFAEDDCIVFYGSLNLAKRIQKKAKWVPGVYYNIPAYECVNYYASLGKYLLNNEYVMLPFGELGRRKEWLYKHFGVDRTIFIRPNRGDKRFTGQVVYKEDFEATLDRFYLNNSTELVIVSKPKIIKYEWRFVVSGTDIIAGSQYKANGIVGNSADYPQDAAKFAQEISREYNPDKIWIVDICLSSDEFKLVEIGCFSCAGLYACDRAKIVDHVEKIALEEWEELQ